MATVRSHACLLVVLLGCVACCIASSGDRSEDFRDCVDGCLASGCVGSSCIGDCQPSKEGENVEVAKRLLHDPWFLRWTRWDCEAECRYQCMFQREAEKVSSGQESHKSAAAAAAAVEKYYGKWPFVRVMGLQEPASVLFSLLNLLCNVYGLLDFVSLVYSKLPRRTGGGQGPFYEYTTLWTIYGIFSVNTWLWSAVFHARDTKATEALDYSSAIALLGFGLILAVIRTAGLRLEAARVMASAPIIAFISTHILFLNFYEFDYGWNMWVCLTIGILQLVMWTAWATAGKHPARGTLWLVAIGTVASLALEILDFPPLLGYLDAHSLWHLAKIPLTLLFWQFVKVDAKHRTHVLVNRVDPGVPPAEAKKGR